MNDNEHKHRYSNEREISILEAHLQAVKLQMKKQSKTMLIEGDEETLSATGRKTQTNLRSSLPHQKYIVQNGIELSLKHCFALSSSLTQTPVQYLSDDQLLFVIGQYLVIHNGAISNQQTYMEIEQDFSSIHFLTTNVLPDKTTLIAYSDHVSEISREQYASIGHKRFFSFSNREKKAKPSPSSKNEQTQKLFFRGQVAIVGTKEKHVLTQISNEPFNIRQIVLVDKKHCFVLCENAQGDQVIHIWSVEKDVLLVTIEMKFPARKFAINPTNKSQMIICAPQLLRNIEINLVNKIVKNNNPSFVPMKIERTNNFIDLDYVRGTNILVVMASTNSLFVFKELVLLYQITNFDIQRGLEAQKVVFFDKFDNITTEPEIEDISQQEPEPILGGISELLVPEEVKSCKFKCGIMEATLMEKLKHRMTFQKLVVSDKHIFVASKGGYLTIFLLDNTLQSPPVHLKTAQLPEHIISIKQLLLNQQGTALTCVGKYPFQIKEKLIINSSKKSNKKSKENPGEIDIDKQLYDYNLKYDVFSISLSGLMEGNLMIINRVFPQGVHDGSIFQIAGCKSRSGFVTVADGKSIRFWNHTNEFSGEDNFLLDEQPLSVDWHPFSLQIALGFPTGLRLYIVRESRLVLAYHRGTKHTSVIKYNNSGSLLAAADSFYILLLDPLRFEVIRELTGHSSSIRDIYFSPRADFLFTASKEILITWAIPELLQTDRDEAIPFARYSNKQDEILSCEYDSNLSVLTILTTSHLTLLTQRKHMLLGTINFLEEIVEAKPIKHIISFNLNILIMAFHGGYIRLYYWPFIVGSEQYYEVYIDPEAEITDIYITPCSKVLVVGMSNGNIFCLEISKILEGHAIPWGKTHTEWDKAYKLRNYHGLSGFSIMDSVMLTSQSRMKSFDKIIEELRRNIYNEKSRILYKLQKQWEEYCKRENEVQDKLDKDLIDQNINWETEQNERNARLVKLQNELIQVENLNKIEQEKVKFSHKQLMQITKECNHEFDTELKKQKIEMKTELEKLLAEHKKAIKNVKMTQEDYIHSAKYEIGKLINDFEQLCGQREGILSRQEEDHETELEKMDVRQYRRLLILKNESLNCARKCIELQKIKDEVDKVLTRKQAKIDKLSSGLEKTEQDYEMAQKRIIAMNQQLHQSKLFESDKKKELHGSTTLRNMLESGTTGLIVSQIVYCIFEIRATEEESKVNDLNKEKEPMVAKLKNHEEYTTRAYNEMIHLLQLRGASERMIDDTKLKLSNTEEDHSYLKKLSKLLSTFIDLYDKGIYKLYTEREQDLASIDDLGVRTAKTDFEKKVVEFIWGLQKEVQIDNLEHLPDIDQVQKNLERNTQLMKRAKMVTETERINKNIKQGYYKLMSNERLEAEAVHTLTRQNINLLSERNILKQKCGELESQAKSLDNSISLIIDHIKNKSFYMGKQLEEKVRSELLTKLGEKSKAINRREGRRANSTEPIARSLNRSASKANYKKTNMSGIATNRMIHTARMQTSELHSQREAFSEFQNGVTQENIIRVKTASLAASLMPSELRSVSRQEMSTKRIPQSRERSSSRPLPRRLNRVRTTAGNLQNFL